MKDLEKKIAELEERLDMRDAFEYADCYETKTLYTVDGGYKVGQRGKLIKAWRPEDAIYKYIKTHRQPMRIVVFGINKPIDAYWSEVNECPVINGRYYK